ncbi:cell division protein FtsL [Bacilliculturomica massiliensis]|uniref:cell division protein FtsL n=1 Tax=Bacilliculturomica massiliensis TaxID=1917867 RepID=UPI001030B98B|nr:cell division protein FtsL [Bacilliculturomica massiliensis]
MIAAEKWYEQQVRYQKYGIDMKPVQERIRQEKPKTGTAALSAKDKLRMLMLTVLFGALFIGFIAVTAYSAKIQYDINKMMEDSKVLQGEIQNLDVKIKSATNIQIIEEKAVARLGMVYPSMSEVIYIQADTEPAGNFAMALKEQAYN